jgi:hypothetical protein
MLCDGHSTGDHQKPEQPACANSYWQQHRTVSGSGIDCARSRSDGLRFHLIGATSRPTFGAALSLGTSTRAAPGVGTSLLCSRRSRPDRATCRRRIGQLRLHGAA